MLVLLHLGDLHRPFPHADGQRYFRFDLLGGAGLGVLLADDPFFILIAVFLLRGELI